MSSRSFCFTYNNPTALLDFEYDDPNQLIRYAIYSEEVAASGTHHFQGYIEYYKTVRITQAQSLNNFQLENVHFEKRKGSPQQAIDYVKKIGTIYDDGTTISGPYEFGSPSKAPGKRNDIIEFVKDIKEGKGNTELLEQHTGTFVRYAKMIPVIRQMYAPKPVLKPIESFNHERCELTTDRSVIFYGPSSIGKTQFALAHFKNPFLVTHLDNLLHFWDEKYDGIVFDDLSFNHLPPEARIKILDRRMMTTVHIRYTTVQLPPEIPRIFTHNREDIFLNKEDHEDQSLAIQYRYVSYPFTEQLYIEDHNTAI